MVYLAASVLAGTASAGGLYAAVRADLRGQRKDIDKNSRAIAKAHERIDAILLAD